MLLDLTNEEQNDKYHRLRAMVAPGQKTWDLSPKDVEAIRFAIQVIDHHNRTCESIKNVMADAV